MTQYLPLFLEASQHGGLTLLVQEVSENKIRDVYRDCVMTAGCEALTDIVRDW